MGKKVNLTAESKRCGHCGVTAKMEILKEFKHQETENIDFGDFRQDIEVYNYYDVLRCLSCNDVEFRCCTMSEVNDLGEYRTLYPVAADMPPLPTFVGKPYVIAHKERYGSANAYAVAIGRLLECVCIHKGAKKDTLARMLKELLAKGVIPQSIYDIADGVRLLRNVSAHNGTLPQDEIPLLEKITRITLEHIYTVPWLTRRAKAVHKKFSK